MHAAGIRASDDDEIAIAFGGDRGTQLGDHRFGAHQRFARQMAAPLGQLLIFQMNAGDACFLEKLHRPLHVQRFAETGVGVT